MSPITRSWLAFAAVGTGLIHVALVLGSPLPLGIVLAVLGLAEFGWGVLTFARESIALPRVALAVALAPILGWAALLGVTGATGATEVAASLPFLPMGIAVLFELIAAVLLASRLRRTAPPPAPGVAKYLLGLLAGAVVVGALTTPALAATRAGDLAVEHGELNDEGPIPIQPGHPGH